MSGRPCPVLSCSQAAPIIDVRHWSASTPTRLWCLTPALQAPPTIDRKTDWWHRSRRRNVIADVTSYWFRSRRLSRAAFAVLARACVAPASWNQSRTSTQHKWSLGYRLLRGAGVGQELLLVVRSDLHEQRASAARRLAKLERLHAAQADPDRGRDGRVSYATVALSVRPFVRLSVVVVDRGRVSDVGRRRRRRSRRCCFHNAASHAVRDRSPRPGQNVIRQPRPWR